MKTIIVRKKSIGLNKVSCSCGYISFATTSDQIDYLAYQHSLKHKRFILETYHDGVFYNPNRKRAMPNRNSGTSLKE